MNTEVFTHSILYHEFYEDFSGGSWIWLRSGLGFSEQHFFSTIAQFFKCFIREKYISQNASVYCNRYFSTNLVQIERYCKNLKDCIPRKKSNRLGRKGGESVIVKM